MSAGVRILLVCDYEDDAEEIEENLREIVSNGHDVDVDHVTRDDFFSWDISSNLPSAYVFALPRRSRVIIYDGNDTSNSLYAEVNMAVKYGGGTKGS